MKGCRIAITGGIATGKSTVANMFAELGAVILDADQFARQAVQPGAPCWKELREILPDDFFDPGGHLERRKLRECIIKSNECRDQVNSILHPCVMHAMEQERQQRVRSGTHNLIIFDIPLLFEAASAHRFDIVVLVYAPRETQIQRLQNRDDISRQQAESTLAMQLPIEAKKEMAHIIIDNTFGLEHTKKQVLKVWRELQKRTEGRQVTL